MSYAMVALSLFGTRMIYIYHCFGGAHSSVTTAAIHLNMLSSKNVPTKKEVLSLPLYDRVPVRNHGYIHFYGTDLENNEVYVIGLENISDRVIPVFQNLIRLFGVNNVVLVNTLSYVNIAMKVGGVLSRALRLVFLGRPLVIWGTRGAWYHLRTLVKLGKVETVKAQTKKATLFYTDRNRFSAHIAAAIFSGKALIEEDIESLFTTIRLDEIFGHKTGQVFDYGDKEEGHRVLAVYTGKKASLFARSILNLTKVVGIKDCDLIEVKVGQNFWYRYGSFLLSLGFTDSGRRILYRQILRDYDKYVKLFKG